MSNAGRPLKFKTVEELQEKIDEWYKSRVFNKVKVLTKSGEIAEIDKPLPLTVTSLAVFLDTSRETLINYENREQFFDTIKRAKEICVMDAEDRLYNNFTPGVIFSMKNNYGWTDKQEVEHSGDQNISINFKIPRPKGDE